MHTDIVRRRKRDTYGYSQTEKEIHTDIVRRRKRYIRI